MVSGFIVTLPFRDLFVLFLSRINTKEEEESFRYRLEHTVGLICKLNPVPSVKYKPKETALTAII